MSSSFFFPPSRRADLRFLFFSLSKRGTIYGIYDLSEQIGVSPWFWWSDVRILPQESLYVSNEIYVHASPTVKYRGFFLNDEQPSLTNWAVERYGTNSSAPFQHEVSRRSSRPLPSLSLYYSSLALSFLFNSPSFTLLPSFTSTSTSSSFD